MTNFMTLTLSAMAHGGVALGRNEQGRVVFVPYTIPGETVSVSVKQSGRGTQATLLDVVDASAERVAPRCSHFGHTKECDYQHMTYEAQLRYKQLVVADQLQRLGRFKDTAEVVLPTLPNPEPWAYQRSVTLSPAPEGGVGYWDPVDKTVRPFTHCAVLHPTLSTLLQDIDLDLPGLRKATLHVGADDALLLALEVDGIEPPALSLDFPLSVVIVLPDRTTANLIGDNFVIQTVKGRDFRVSAGCRFMNSLAGAELLVDTVLTMAALQEDDLVLELHSGVGMLTTFLSDVAGDVACFEENADAVADAADNLDHTDNVTLFEGDVAGTLSEVEIEPDVAIVSPPEQGVNKWVLHELIAMRPLRIVYISSDVATLARDGRHLADAGYTLQVVQPIDTLPQHHRLHTVSCWELLENDAQVEDSEE